MARNKPRKQGTVVNNSASVDVKEVNTTRGLPVHYIAFPDDLKYALKRIQHIEEKLFSRGFKVVSPLHVYRYTVGANVYSRGKQKPEVKLRAKPYSMICVELEKL